MNSIQLILEEQFLPGSEQERRERVQQTAERYLRSAPSYPQEPELPKAENR